MLHIINYSVCDGVFSAEGEKLSVVGSPFWMAPEVLRDEPYNEKVDVYLYSQCCYGLRLD